MNYYLSVLVPKKQWLSEIETLIEDYVLNGLNVSKDKIYSDPAEGGLGLFKPELFFKALKFTWIRRALALTHDNWRRKIINFTDPGPCYIQKRDIQDFGPLLSEILLTLIDFREAFGTQSNNFLAVPILNNNNFFYKENRTKVCLDDDFFNNSFPGLDPQRCRTLSWLDCINNGEMKSINQLQTGLGIPIAASVHRKLSTAFILAKKNFSNQEGSTSIFGHFCEKKFKGSRDVRKLFFRAWYDTGKKRPKCPIINYASIAGIETVNVQASKHLNNLWKLHFLSSEIKTFLFKLHHNILGINSRVHHINNTRDPSCSFCIKTKNLPAERETFTHFFWFCPTTHNLIIKFFEVYFRDEVQKTRTLFFTGIVGTNVKNFSLPVLLVLSLFKYILWNFKLRKKLPSWPSLNNEFLYMFDIITKSSRKIQENVASCKWFKHSRQQ
jgi:hypothetical protein